jgi:L-amino acid N-acyltransferase YncA
MSRTQVEGLVAGIRPARTADLPALGHFFAGLSVQTRYLRFFSPITPGPSLLNLLCGGDGTTDALLATRDSVIIGHGMAADRSGLCGARTTDIGVVVADAWQRQGVGSALVRALITGAQVRGVTKVTMDVMHGNDRALAMIKGHWPAARTRRSRDCVTIHVQLADYQDRQPPAHLARVENQDQRSERTVASRSTATVPALGDIGIRWLAEIPRHPYLRADQLSFPASAIEATRVAMAGAWSSCGKCLPGMRSMAARPAAARALSP